MVFNELYEVSRDEYVGFLDQIKPSFRLVEQVKMDGDYNAIVIRSMKTGKDLCGVLSYTGEDDVPSKFYVFNMPDNDERQPSKPKQKIVLETQEEVQAVLNILASLNKKGDKNDRAV